VGSLGEWVVGSACCRARLPTQSTAMRLTYPYCFSRAGHGLPLLPQLVPRLVLPHGVLRVLARVLLRVLISAMVVLCAGPLQARGTRDADRSATSVSGMVTHVTDGDTVWLRVDSGPFGRKPIALRLVGIDAPERCQAAGAQATAVLTARLLNRRVVATLVAKDVYHRWLAEVRLRGDNVSARMVRDGYAWSDRHGDAPGRYAAEERAARTARRGLFADGQAIEPRVFRKQHGTCAHAK
jgi:micrococcal nuclease